MEPNVNIEKARHVCVVDDDDAVRESTRLLLESAGYAVRDYASAEAFLADGDAPEAACLVLDFQMGGMTGLELVELLRARGIWTPAIIVTGNGSHFDDRYVRAKVLAVLRKPSSSDELLAWTEKACAQS
jgi:FixJ family two-component response regulator